MLLLTPTSKKGNVLDIIKISSAEGRSHVGSLFTYENGNPVTIRYVDKKRIQSWLNVNRLQLPLHNLDLDSNTSIDEFNDSVNPKSATDSDGNQLSAENPDIRYSVGAKTDKAVQAMLETENQKLQEDVAKLKELLKLQGVETGGTKFLESSVLAAARYLKKNSDTSGNTKELAKMLNDFYEHIATSKDLTWEAVREQALACEQSSVGN